MRKNVSAIILKIGLFVPLCALLGCTAVSNERISFFASSNPPYYEQLGPDIDEGSWWTDGDCFYQLKRRGSTYLLEGCTLHEGGMETALSIVNDTLRVSLPPCEYTTFAEEGCLVRHYSVTVWNPDSTNVEFLAAFAKDDAEDTPIAVLQRFDGDAEKYLLNSVYALLQGTYSDGTSEWTFLPDGTVRLSADSEAKPYSVERIYDMPTNVVCLPDERHVALQIEDSELTVLQVTYDSDEEVWMEAYPQEVLMQMKRTSDDSIYRNLLSDNMLLNWTMMVFMEGNLDDIVQRYSFLESCDHIIGKFNYYLLNHWIKLGVEDEEEMEEEDLG